MNIALPIYLHNLAPRTAKIMTILFACYGATPGYNNVSLANIIADTTGSVVYAVKNAKVNYYKGIGLPYLIDEGF